MTTANNDVAGKRIGLLGGSFNPAHAGHIFISKEAMVRLNLDRVWWLVAPQNPLKDAAGLAPLIQRFAAAEKFARGADIEVLNLESEQSLAYTIDTLVHLREKFPGAHFVWLMGADCFAELDRWKSWQEIMAIVPLAVFSRPGYQRQALSGKAATKYRDFRVTKDKFSTLAVTDPPAWGYIETEGPDTSATELRRDAG